MAKEELEREKKVLTLAKEELGEREESTDVGQREREREREESTDVGHDLGLPVLLVVEILADLQLGDQVPLLPVRLLHALHRVLQPQARLLKLRRELVAVRTVCTQPK